MKAQVVKAQSWKAKGRKLKGAKRFPYGMRDDLAATTLRGAWGYIHKSELVRSWIPVVREPWKVCVRGAGCVRSFEAKRDAIDYLRAWRICNGYDEHGMPR